MRDTLNADFEDDPRRAADALLSEALGGERGYAPRPPDILIARKGGELAVWQAVDPRLDILDPDTKRLYWSNN
jgi:hypothetical protein